MNTSTWDLFVCHASEDKDDIVRPLVAELRARDLTVWYDEFELRVGDSLRESIDRGLLQSRFGLVVLSPAFFEKRWATTELDGLLALEKPRRKVLLPIWHDITAEEVAACSPLLAGRVGIPTDKGVERVASQIIEAMESYQEKASESGQISLSSPVPVVLAGCGWWARHRTVFPLCEGNPGLCRIVGVTALKDGESEFRQVVVPEMELHKIPVPVYYDNLIRAIRTARDSLQTPTDPLCVLINTPNCFHAEHAENAIERGCHVYAERPIQRHSEKLEILMALADQKRVHLFNGVQRRLEAPYQYLFDVIHNKLGFGVLRSIRCVLASGRQVDGWRRERHMAGGGIVIDEGYHLLDAAVWLLEAAQPGTQLHSRDIRVSVYSSNSRTQPEVDVEVSAVGTAILPGDVSLHFDLSYEAPRDSVFELLEIRDAEGNRVRLMRDNVQRSSHPGRVVHQAHDGSVRGQGFVEIDPAGAFSFVAQNPASGPNNIGPLRQFLFEVSRHPEAPPASLLKRLPRQNECHARFVMNTQELIAAIYQAIDAYAAPSP